MATQENYKDEWLERAFRLAFFLHGDRETAKKIAFGAMNKLETASTAQFKRHYYTPTGRAENSKVTRSRVSLSDLQLLQRLVFVESEAYEREKENGKKTSEKDLLTFFIKHLVRISLKRNSFYVTLAVSRILHNYPTADAMEIYNVVVQDPDRVHDDYYYRSRKGVLMKELKARFGELLEIVKVNRGEDRFNSKASAKNSAETARECLKFFTPWNSSCAIPETFDPFTDVIKQFYFDKTDPDEEHRTEVSRIHATLHPDCFNRLTQALNLSSPQDTMEIPKFMLTENQANFDDNDWRNPPPLDADELRLIKEILSAQAANRKAVSAGFLRVVADGSEIGKVDPAETNPARFDLGGDAELIEIYADGNTLLATHLLNFAKLRKGEQTHSILLEGGQRITLELVPSLDEFGEVAEVTFGVSYAETSLRRRLALALLRTRAAIGNSFDQPILKPALTFGIVLLTLAAGWFVFQKLDERPDVIADGPKPLNQNSQVNPFQPPPEEREIVPNTDDSKGANRPVSRPDEMANSQTPKREIRKETAPKKEKIVEPQSGEVANTISKDEIDDNGVLRLPMRESNRNSSEPRFDRREKSTEVRGHSRKFSGKSFNEIKQIYLELSGDEILGKQIAAQIVAELGTSSRFIVTSDKEQADAALKLYVRHESDGDEPDEKTVAVIVRLVNAKGFVVYPNRKGISGWKYVGTINKLPLRVARDLAKTKR